MLQAIRTPKKIPTHIPLEGACNARHLGGYPTPEGVTRNFLFIRCEAPTDFTGCDIAVLLKLGVRTVIDLRTREETACPPDFQQGIRHTRCPFYKSAALREYPERRPFSFAPIHPAGKEGIVCYSPFRV